MCYFSSSKIEGSFVSNASISYKHLQHIYRLIVLVCSANGERPAAFFPAQTMGYDNVAISIHRVNYSWCVSITPLSLARVLGGWKEAVYCKRDDVMATGLAQGFHSNSRLWEREKGKLNKTWKTGVISPNIQSEKHSVLNVRPAE